MQGPGTPRPKAGKSLSRTIHICFVCTGNICRSPFAERYLEHLLARTPDAGAFRITSCGTLGVSDRESPENVLEAAGEHGISLADHLSCSLRRRRREEKESPVDVWIGMAMEHVECLRELSPRGQVHLFSEWLIDGELSGAGDSNTPLLIVGSDTPDPMGMGLEAARDSLEKIARQLERVLPGIRGLARGETLGE